MSDEYNDVNRFITKFAYSIYRREKQLKVGGPPDFELHLIDLDRFSRPEEHEFSADGSNPNESLSMIDHHSVSRNFEGAERVDA